MILLYKEYEKESLLNSTKVSIYDLARVSD